MSFLPLSISPLIGGLLQGSALVLALWLLFRLMPRISPNTRAWLWRLAILKLALSAISIGQVDLHILPQTGYGPAKSASRRLPPLPIPKTFVEASSERSRNAKLTSGPAVTTQAAREFASRAPTHNQTARIPQTDFNFGLLAIGFWCVGLSLSSLPAIFDAVRSRRWLRQVAPVTDPDILECTDRLSENAGLARSPRLVWSEIAPGPMVYGIWRPVIVLPKRLHSDLGEDLQLALAHEIAHIRRRDLAWAVVAWLVRSVLFFNPAAWFAAKELRAAQESATDQEAVWLSGARISAYGEMLLRAMTPNRVVWNPSGLPMFDSFREAQRRLYAMKHFSDQRQPSRKAIALIALVIGVGCLPTYTLVPASAASLPEGLAEPQAPAANLENAAGNLRQVPSKTGHSPRKPAASASEQWAGPPPFPPVHAPLVSQTVEKRAKVSPKYLDLKFAEVVPSNSDKHLTLSGTNSSSPTSPFERLGSEIDSRQITASLQSQDLKLSAKEAHDAFAKRVAELIANQNARISDYRRGADQREWDAEQREREAQQRKREGEQRARAALLRQQVFQEREKNGYRIFGPAQREVDQRQRSEDARSREADQYQLVIDQKQRATDQWQREFDQQTIVAIRKETLADIATARSEYQKRLRELWEDDESRIQASTDPAIFAKRTSPVDATRLLGADSHVVKTDSGLLIAISKGYEVSRVRTSGKGAYAVTLTRTKG